MSKTSARKSSRALTSKKSLRSSLESSISLSSKTDLPASFIENKLQRLLEKEEEDQIIYSIREELMHRVMEECQNRYMAKQSVKFTAHCAYRALAQLVHLGLFNHDAGKPFYLEHPAWTPDLPPEPSPPDSWSAKHVPIKEKPILTSPSSTAFDIDSKISELSVSSVLENVFTGIKEKSEETKEEFAASDGISVIYEAPKADFMHVESSVMFSEFQGLLAPHGTEATIIDEELSQEYPERPMSIFTKTTLMPPEHLPHSIKSGRSKLKGFLAGAVAHPHFSSDDLPSTKTKFSFSKLPPLRKETKAIKFQAPPPPPPEEPKKESPKKGTRK